MYVSICAMPSETKSYATFFCCTNKIVSICWKMHLSSEDFIRIFWRQQCQCAVWVDPLNPVYSIYSRPHAHTHQTHARSHAQTQTRTYTQTHKKIDTHRHGGKSAYACTHTRTTHVDTHTQTHTHTHTHTHSVTNAHTRTNAHHATHTRTHIHACTQIHTINMHASTLVRISRAGAAAASGSLYNRQCRRELSWFLRSFSFSFSQPCSCGRTHEGCPEKCPA